MSKDNKEWTVNNQLYNEVENRYRLSIDNDILRLNVEGVLFALLAICVYLYKHECFVFLIGFKISIVLIIYAALPAWQYKIFAKNKELDDYYHKTIEYNKTSSDRISFDKHLYDSMIKMEAINQQINFKRVIIIRWAYIVLMVSLVLSEAISLICKLMN